MLEGVEVVGLVDPAPAALARALAESGFGPGFASLEALLAAARPDAALVLTPKQTHHAVVRRLLEAGVDVFCEKPLATTVPEAEALVAQAARAGRVLMVGFNRRYAPVYVAAREAFAEHRPEACLALKNRPGTEYRATLENAIHMVDLLRWFCGEAVDVHGRAAFTRSLSRDDGGGHAPVRLGRPGRAARQPLDARTGWSGSRSSAMAARPWSRRRTA